MGVGREDHGVVPGSGPFSIWAFETKNEGEEKKKKEIKKRNRFIESSARSVLILL